MNEAKVATTEKTRTTRGLKVGDRIYVYFPRLGRDEPCKVERVYRKDEASLDARWYVTIVDTDGSRWLKLFPADLAHRIVAD